MASTEKEVVGGIQQPGNYADEKGHAADTPEGVQATAYANNLALGYTENLTFAAILKGTAAHPLNTFEKKAALINLELDKFGLGRYQICIWFLCGFGYFLDLAWSQGVGLISTAIYQEMGVADKDTGQIFALANAGLAIGALGFGLAVDIIGRKWAFQLTCLITSVFGLLLVRCHAIPVQHSIVANMLPGRPKVQLWCYLWHLLSSIAWPWW